MNKKNICDNGHIQAKDSICPECLVAEKCRDINLLSSTLAIQNKSYDALVKENTRLLIIIEQKDRLLDSLYDSVTQLVDDIDRNHNPFSL